MNNELIFTAKSCLYYYTSDIYESEKKYLLNKSFLDYIISRKCQEKNINVQILIKEVNKEDNRIGQFLEIPQTNRVHLNPIRPPKRQFSSKAGVIKNIEENKANNITHNSSIKSNELNFKKNITRKASHDRYHTPILVNNTVNNNNIYNKQYISSANLNGYKKIPQIPRNKCNKIIDNNNYSEYKRIFTQPNREHNYLIEKNENNQIKNKESELTNAINENFELKKKIEELKKELNKLNDYKIKMEEKEKEIQIMKKQSQKEMKCLKERLVNLEKEINDYKKSKEEAKKLYQINIDNKENEEFIYNKNQNEKLKKENIDLINQNKELENKLRQKQVQLSQDNHSPLPYEPLANYKEPTLIGLNNIGATCFMNSTLQCLSQTQYLTNYFLNDSKKKMIIDNNIANENKNLPQLSPVYLKVIKKLWYKNKKRSSFSPSEFMETVEKMNPLFKKGQARDSKDFIIFILDQIHKELKRQNNFQSKPIIQPLNQYDKNNVYAYFMKESQKEYSIISDNFYGIKENTTICLYCKSFYASKGINYPICFNYEIFNCLIFPLEEINNYRNEYCAKFYNQINQNNSINLIDCFSYNQKTNIFNGRNRNFCNICHQLYYSEVTSRIYSSPNILVLILNRGNDNEYKIKVDFTEALDLTQFVVSKDRPQMIYNLYGVITHVEQSGSKAHFIGFCKSPINNKWYKYNDAIINQVEDVQKEIISFGSPIILFYQKPKLF